MYSKNSPQARLLLTRHRLWITLLSTIHSITMHVFALTPSVNKTSGRHWIIVAQRLLSAYSRHSAIAVYQKYRLPFIIIVRNQKHRTIKIRKQQIFVNSLVVAFKGKIEVIWRGGLITSIASVTTVIVSGVARLSRREVVMTSVV